MFQGERGGCEQGRSSSQVLASPGKNFILRAVQFSSTEWSVFEPINWRLRSKSQYCSGDFWWSFPVRKSAADLHILIQYRWNIDQR